MVRADSVPRPSWDEIWFNVAEIIGKRATCRRALVGAVIVDANDRILGTGYNGAPAGRPHCLDVGCDVVDNHCVRTIHAEGNAIAYAARSGISIEGAQIYVSFDGRGSSFDQIFEREEDVWSLDEFPCYTCRGPLMASGVEMVSVKRPGQDGEVMYVRDYMRRDP